MKLKHLTELELSNKIEARIKSDIPQVTLEIEEEGGFHNILQAGTRKMWFIVGTDNKRRTTLYLTIAIQDSDENYEITAHRFVKLRSVDDMVELVNYTLKLNCRI